MNSGCRYCTNREPGCHSSCETYKAFKNEIARINKVRDKYNLAPASLYANKFRRFHK